MNQELPSNRIWLVSGVFVLALVFLIDVFLPLGAVIGAIYVLVSLIALRVSAFNAIVLASVATATNVTGYCLAPVVSIPEWIVATNRIFAIVTTWLVIMVSSRIHQHFQSMIHRLHELNERRRLALEGAELGFWVEHIPEGTIVFDDRWVAMLGYSSADVRNSKQWYERLVHPDDLELVQAARNRHYSGDTNRFQVEHRLRANDGSWRWILTKGRVIARSVTGQPLRAAGTHLDVTSTRDLERQAEQALRDRMEELQLLTDAIPMMISYVSHDKRFQLINSSYERMFNISSEKMKDMHLREVIGNEEYARMEPYIEAALRGKRVQFEERFTTNGKNYWWLVQYLPRIDKDRQVLGFYGIITDVTQMKQSEEEVNQSRIALSSYDRRSAANEMAAALAHELNQPLASIAIYASRLSELCSEEQGEGASYASTLARIHQEALHAGQILRQARALVDHEGVRLSPIGVAQLIASVRQLCEVRMLAARVPVEVCIDDEVDTIPADLLKMQLVLVNLVHNAMEASRDVSEERRLITIKAVKRARGVQIDVIDRGQGLTRSQIKDVFTPYFSTKQHGLGIGLNICRSLVSAHGGKLWATPNHSVGVTFHVFLPSAPEGFVAIESTDDTVDCAEQSSSKEQPEEKVAYETPFGPPLDRLN